jgi:hypothetical protein
MKLDTLEFQLFEWQGWDEDGPADLTFHDVVLKVPVGKFPVGAKFPEAVWIGSKSALILIDEDDTEHFFELKVSVGQELQESDLLDEEDDPAVSGKVLN